MARHLAHVHLKVRDAERAVDFYTDVFDLEVTERVDQYVFLTFGDHHHDVALQEVDEDPVVNEGEGDVFHEADDEDDGDGVGLYHAAFEVDDESELADLYDRIRDQSVETTCVDHGISKAVYFEDPCGNGLEAYVDTRTGDDDCWEGENERFDPKAL